MNKGLKSYTNQLEHHVGNLFSTYVNLNKEDANFHIQIPLINTNGKTPINTSLIYNYQDRNLITEFNKGFKLNYYSKLTEYDNKIVIKNADGSSDEYIYDSVKSVYYCQQVYSTIEKLTQCERNSEYKYKLMDKFGNTVYYDGVISYPREIISVDNENIEIRIENNKLIINNQYQNKIEFSLDNLGVVNEIIFYCYNLAVIKLELLYSQNILSSICYRQKIEESFTYYNKCHLWMYSNSIELYEENTSKKSMITISSGRVISVKDGLQGTYDDYYQYVIDYYDSYTVVEDIYGHKTTYFFDNNQLPIYYIDHLGNVTKTTFNNQRLTYISSPIPVYNKLENLFGTDQLSDFFKLDVSISKVTTNNSFFANILNDSLYRITANDDEDQMLEYDIQLDKCNDENIVALLWGRIIGNWTSSVSIDISLWIDDNCYESVKLKNDINQEIFNLIVLSAKPNKAYSRCKILIEILGSVEFEIGGIQLINKDIGTKLQYDINGNLIKRITKYDDTTYKYNELNKLQYSYNNLQNSSVTYDNETNLSSNINSNNINVQNEYNEESSNSLSSQVISDSKGSEKYYKNYSYTADGKYVETYLDEFNNLTMYSYDSSGRVNNVKSNDEISKDISYYNLHKVSKVRYKSKSEDGQFTNNFASIDYYYDTLNNLTNIILKNGSQYQFQYDNNLLKNVYLDGELVTHREYETKTENIIKDTLNLTGNGYKYEYQDNGYLLSKIYLINNNNVETLKYQFIYDNRNNLIELQNNTGSTIRKFTYNNDNYLIKEEDDNLTIEYNYNSTGHLTSKKIFTNNENKFCFYNYNNETTNARIEKFINNYSKDSYVGVLADTVDLKGNGVILKGTDKINYHESFGFYNVNSLPSLHLQGIKKLSYQLQCKNEHELENGCVKFWFYTTGNITTEQYLFSCKDQNSSAYIAAYIKNNKVFVEITNEQGNRYNILESTNSIKINDWNFFACSFQSEEGNELISNRFNCVLFLNSDYKTALLQNKSFSSFEDYPEYNIGHKYFDNSRTKDFSGFISCLSLSCRKFERVENIKKYYTMCKEQILYDLTYDASDSMKYNSSTLLQIDNEYLNSFKIFPLINDTKSLDNEGPKTYYKKIINEQIQPSEFKFNEEVGHSAFVADGASLMYDLGINNEGTIMFKAFTNITLEKQYLFEAKDKFGKRLGLYRNSNNILCINYNGVVKNTSLILSNDEWHFIAFSFFKPEVSSAYYNKDNVYIRVIVDESSRIFNVTPVEFDTLLFSIGKDYTTTSISDVCYFLDEYFPFYGQIEMLCASEAFCEIDTLKNLSKQLYGKTTLKKYDDFERLKSSSIYQGGNKVLSSEYDIELHIIPANNKIDYYFIKETESSANNIIEKVFKYNKKHFVTYSKITIKNNNNVISYTEEHNYEYDLRGFLMKDTCNTSESENTTVNCYQYDENGNILQNNNIVFEYQTNIVKDKLIKVNNNNVTYNSNNSLYISRYQNYIFTYENSKLTQCIYGSRPFYFNYDELGRRIKKTNYMSIGSDYIYENDLLVTEINRDYRLDFLYDDLGQLYGFIKDKKDTYYYIRDILKNIIAITTNTGEIVVKYKYDAYGKKLGITGSLASTLGIQNPFRYKGYYYDEETGLFWLSSRYYSPELCRFISPDSVDYLDPNSINGLNLYAYCNNDPVNMCDPSGHIAISTLLIGMAIGFGVGFAIGGGFEIAKQAYNGGDWNWDMSSWNWGQIGLSALGGAVAGAISSISFGSGVVGYLTTFATGGVGSVLGGMISGSVTDLQSGLIAFGIGAVANVAARGITAIINKGVSANAQKALSNPIFDDMTLGDLVGSGLKNNGYAPAYNKFLNYAGNLVLKANGQWTRSSMYSFANAGISNLLSGWY